MVSSVSSSTVMAQQVSQTSGSTSSLTASQLGTISSTLEQFDSSNLSSKDAASIVSAFESAGIAPSEELASAMEDAGFDAREVGDAAGLGGAGMPPPPPPSDEELSEVTDLLDALLSLEEDEESSSPTDIMEYTSRILNLNESSKTEVMDMLEKFSANEEEYSDEEVSNILKNSLSSILSDSSNYNNVSIFA